MKIYKNNKLVYQSLFFLLITLTFYGCKKSEDEHPRYVLSELDQQFLYNAGLYNTSEIELAKIAKEKSKDSSIIKYADKVLKDHRKSQTELIGLGALKQYEVPNFPDSAINNNLFYMKGLQGEFDNVYISQQYTIHQNTIEIYDEISKKGMDVDIKSFANKNLPMLYNHLIKTDSIKKSLGKF